MKKVHADWEIRNFGVDCIEFHLEKGDTVEHLQEAEQSILDFHGLVTYIVPAGDCHLQTTFLEDRGYHLDHAIIENAFDYPESWEYLKNLEYLTNKYKLHKIIKRSDMERICEEICKGIFDSSKERYATISNFDDYKCNRRIAWWLQDWFLEKKIVLIEIINEEKKGVAFFSYIPKSNFVVQAHLNGVYVNKKEDNIGICQMLLANRYYYTLGVKHVIGSASSNNLVSLRMSGKLGGRVTAMRYYFSKEK